MVREAIGYLTSTSLVRINSNLNADRFISDILRSVAVPCLTGLPNAIFQQVNARQHVALCVMIFVDIQGIHLLSWPAQSPYMSTIENTWLWIAEILTRHPTRSNTVDEMWHRLELVWNKLPISVILAQFDSIPYRVRPF